jgi:hypothetical protein
VIAAEPRSHPVRTWLEVLTGDAARDVAVRLEQAGYLEHVPSRIPGHRGRWMPVNADWAFAPMTRVTSALDPARPVSAYAAALTGLADAAGLGYRLDQYRPPSSRPVEDLVRDVVARLGPGLQELISQTRITVAGTVQSHH